MMNRLLLLCLLLPTLLCSADWPHWRGPNHDGTTAETLPAPLPQELPLLWTAKVGIGFSSVVVVGDKVLTMGNRTLSGQETDTVWCLSARSGKVIWFYNFPSALAARYYEGGPSATPTVHGDSVYVLSKHGEAFRLHLDSGRVKWRRDLAADHGAALPEWGFAGSPFVDGDRVLLNVGRGGVALDRETGETVWFSSPETTGYASVVPFAPDGGGGTRLLFTANALVGLDAATGKAAFSFPWKSSREVNAADPLVVGKRVLLSSSSGAAMIEPRPGQQAPELVWEHKDLKWYFNPGVLVGGHVYSISGTTHRPTELVCIDAATGKTAWSEPGFGSGGLVASGDTLIVCDQGQLSFVAADSQGYRLLHRQKVLEGTCWTAPTLSGGRIYCRNAAGDLVCLEF